MRHIPLSEDANDEATSYASGKIFFDHGGGGMHKRLDIQCGKVIVDTTDTVVLLDQTAEEKPSDTELPLIRECDEVVGFLLNATRQDVRRLSTRRQYVKQLNDVGDLRHLEEMVEKIATTVPASESELIAKVAVYREYATFRKKRSGLLAMLLGTCSDEIERELLRRKTCEFGEV